MTQLTSGGTFYSNASSNSTESAGCAFLGCGFQLAIWIVFIAISFFIGDYVILTLGGEDSAAVWAGVPWIIKFLIYVFGSHFIIAVGIITLLLSVFGLTPLF